MKKNIWIVALFFCQNIFCQQYQYHFDTLLEYEETTSGATRLYLYNSNDNTFYLSASNSGIVYCRIKDSKNKIIHNYEMISTANDSVTFNYLYSRKWEPNNRNKYFSFYEITEKEIDSTKTEVIVLGYPNKKKKKASHKKELIIDRSELIANKSIIHLFTDGTFPENDSQITKGIPLSIKTESLIEENFRFHHKLIHIEKINLLLTIPKINTLITTK